MKSPPESGPLAVERVTALSTAGEQSRRGVNRALTTYRLFIAPYQPR